MVTGLTEQQVSEVKYVLSEMGHDDQEVEEALNLLSKNIDTPPTKDDGVSYVQAKVAFVNESDWRKKAALAALIIGQGL